MNNHGEESGGFFSFLRSTAGHVLRFGVFAIKWAGDAIGEPVHPGIEVGAGDAAVEQDARPPNDAAARGPLAAEVEDDAADVGRAHQPGQDEEEEEEEGQGIQRLIHAVEVIRCWVLRVPPSLFVALLCTLMLAVGVGIGQWATDFKTVEVVMGPVERTARGALTCANHQRRCVFCRLVATAQCIGLCCSLHVAVMLSPTCYFGLTRNPSLFCCCCRCYCVPRLVSSF